MAEENKVESGVVLPPADFTGQLQKEAQEMGVALNEHQIKQFYDYYELLIHWNTMVNLTAITEQKEVVTKHFSDSLALVKAVPDLAEKEYTLIDVGTGAGFPGIPLKIAFPNLKVTLLDSLNKRINFLNEVIQALELEKIQAVHGRAEDAAHDNVSRETFDFCVSRAVANLSTLSEYCLPFVKVGGWFVPYKSGKLEEEMKTGKGAIRKLGGELEDVIRTAGDRAFGHRESQAIPRGVAGKLRGGGRDDARRPSRLQGTRPEPPARIAGQVPRGGHRDYGKGCRKTDQPREDPRRDTARDILFTDKYFIHRGFGDGFSAKTGRRC